MLCPLFHLESLDSRPCNKQRKGYIRGIPIIVLLQSCSLQASCVSQVGNGRFLAARFHCAVGASTSGTLCLASTLSATDVAMKLCQVNQLGMETRLVRWFMIMQWQSIECAGLIILRS